MLLWDLRFPPRPGVTVRVPTDVNAVGDGLRPEDPDQLLRELFFPFHHSPELVEGLLGQKNRL